jgi:hypothetical protein
MYIDRVNWIVVPMIAIPLAIGFVTFRVSVRVLKRFLVP